MWEPCSTEQNGLLRAPRPSFMTSPVVHGWIVVAQVHTRAFHHGDSRCLEATSSRRIVPRESSRRLHRGPFLIFQRLPQHLSCARRPTSYLRSTGQIKREVTAISRMDGGVPTFLTRLHGRPRLALKLQTPESLTLLVQSLRRVNSGRMSLPTKKSPCIEGSMSAPR